MRWFTSVNNVELKQQQKKSNLHFERETHKFSIVPRNMQQNMKVHITLTCILSENTEGTKLFRRIDEKKVRFIESF